MPETLVEVKDLKMYFPVYSGGLLPRKTRDVRAVDGVTFSINRGETLGLVGESGSGKTTVGLSILQLYRPTAGQVLYQGQDLCRIKGEKLRRARRTMQMIFQDPYGSLDPRMTAADIISEPLSIYRTLPSQRRLERVQELLSLVDLDPAMYARYPHEFSAGQRQRVGIARAVAVDPDFVVCDEPVSALDVCVQAQILELLQGLQSRLNLTYLFIAHDLAVVGKMSHNIAVMYRGRIVELGKTRQVLANAIHPYTKALLSAVPVPDRAIEKTRQRIVLPEDAPETPENLRGCGVFPRCQNAGAVCGESPPAFEQREEGHWVACFSR